MRSIQSKTQIPQPSQSPQITTSQSLLNRRWYMRKTSPNNLRRLGFRYNEDCERDAMTLQIPLYPSLYALLIVDTETFAVRYDVYHELGGLYPPYYQPSRAYEGIISQIDDTILRKMEQLGVKEVKRKKRRMTA